MSSSLSQVNLSVVVDGETTTYNYTSPVANYVYNFLWDGKDGSGNPTTGSFPAAITILDVGSPPYSGEVPSNQTQMLGFTYINWVGLGGWDLSIHHSYDPVRKILYRGDGTQLNASAATINGYNTVVEVDSSQAYVFDTSWRHIATLTGLTGSTKYSFNYDVYGHLSSVVDAYGNTTTINYDSSHKIMGITAPFGQTTSIAVDSNGYISSIQNPNSETWTITNYANGLLHTFQKPSGVTTTMTYDAYGKLTNETSSAGYSDNLSSATNATGWTTTETTALGRSSTHALTITSVSGATGPTGYTRTDTQASGLTSTYSYGPSNSSYVENSNAQFNLNFSNDPRFGTLAQYTSNFSFSYGSLGLNTSTTQTSSPATPTNPFSITSLTVSSSTSSHTTTSTYNASTQQYTLTSPLGRHAYRNIDSHERTTSTQLASLTPFTYSYDSNGRLSQVAQGTSRSTTFAYDTNGNLSSVTNPLSQVVSFTYDNAGRVLTQTLPDLRVIGFSYDSNGNLASVTPPNSQTHTFGNNGFDFISSYITPVFSLMDFSPDTSKATVSTLKRGYKTLLAKMASLTGKVAPKVSNKMMLLTGYETDYTYNNDRQLTRITRPDTSTVQFNYSSTLGTLSSIVLPTGTNTYNFANGIYNSGNSLDGITRIPSWNYTFLTFDTVYYNSSNSIRSIMTFNYNSNLLPSSDVITSTGTTTGTTYNYTYDNDNLLTGAGSEVITRDSSTGFVTQAALGTNLSELYSYTSDMGELSQIRSMYSTTQDYIETITRDNLGRIATRTEQYGSGSSNTYGYTYDSAGRLTDVTTNSVASSHYVYDLNGNRTSQTLGSTTTAGAYDSLDRLVTFGTKTYAYSTSGELQSVSDSSTSPAQVTSYSYDVLGNLKSVTLPSSTVISYLVDANNRRVAKKSGGTVLNYFVYDSKNRVVALMSSSGTITARFVYGVAFNVPDYMVTSSGTYKIVSNHLGSPVEVVNTADNTIVEQITYDEFGNVLSDTNPGYTPFGFAGCLYDTDTKLCHFGGGEKIKMGDSFMFNAGRDYDAYTGRWTNRDPILFKGGDSNLYGYVLNDPISRIDPSGLQGMEPLPEPAENVGQGPFDPPDVCELAPAACPPPPFGQPTPHARPAPTPPWAGQCTVNGDK